MWKIIIFLSAFWPAFSAWAQEQLFLSKGRSPISQVRLLGLSRLIREKLPPQWPAPQVHLDFTSALTLKAYFFPPNKITLGLEVTDPAEQDRLLVHEYFHALHYAQAADAPDWVREGLAQYFEFLVLGRLNPRAIREQFLYPYTPLLVEKYDYSAPNLSLYGHHLMFFYYTLHFCGGSKSFWKLAQMAAPYSLQRVVEQLEVLSPWCQSPRDLVQSFELARFINQYQFGRPHPRQYLLYPLSLAARAEEFSLERPALPGLIYLPTTDSLSIKQGEIIEVNGESFFWAMLP